MKKRTFCVKALVLPGLIEYSEFLLPFELFHHIKYEDLCNEEMSLIKARLLDIALTSYKNFSSDWDPPENRRWFFIYKYSPR